MKPEFSQNFCQQIENMPKEKLRTPLTFWPFDKKMLHSCMLVGRENNHTTQKCWGQWKISVRDELRPGDGMACKEDSWIQKKDGIQIKNDTLKMWEASPLVSSAHIFLHLDWAAE